MLFFFFVGCIREEEEGEEKCTICAAGWRGKGKRRSSPTFQFPKKEELEVFFSQERERKTVGGLSISKLFFFFYSFKVTGSLSMHEVEEGGGVDKKTKVYKFAAEIIACANKNGASLCFLRGFDKLFFPSTKRHFLEDVGIWPKA